MTYDDKSTVTLTNHEWLELIVALGTARRAEVAKGHHGLAQNIANIRRALELQIGGTLDDCDRANLTAARAS